MKILSVALYAISLWISVKQNYTEVHGEDIVEPQRKRIYLIIY